MFGWAWASQNAASQNASGAGANEIRAKDGPVKETGRVSETDKRGTYYGGALIERMIAQRLRGVRPQVLEDLHGVGRGALRAWLKKYGESVGKRYGLPYPPRPFPLGNPELHGNPDPPILPFDESLLPATDAESIIEIPTREESMARAREYAKQLRASGKLPDTTGRRRTEAQKLAAVERMLRGATAEQIARDMNNSSQSARKWYEKYSDRVARRLGIPWRPLGAPMVAVAPASVEPPSPDHGEADPDYPPHREHFGVSNSAVAPSPPVAPPVPPPSGPSNAKRKPKKALTDAAKDLLTVELLRGATVVEVCAKYDVSDSAASKYYGERAHRLARHLGLDVRRLRHTANAKPSASDAQQTLLSRPEPPPAEGVIESAVQPAPPRPVTAITPAAAWSALPSANPLEGPPALAPGEGPSTVEEIKETALRQALRERDAMAVVMSMILRNGGKLEP